MLILKIEKKKKQGIIKIKLGKHVCMKKEIWMGWLLNYANILFYVLVSGLLLYARWYAS